MHPPAWRELPTLLLPDEVPPFAETRALLRSKHALFVEQGGAALGEMVAINERLAAIRASMATEFPLTAEETAVQQEALAEGIMRIHAAEETAVAGVYE